MKKSSSIKKLFMGLSLSFLVVPFLTGCGNQNNKVNEQEKEFYSIYELAADAGFEGDYASWLASIKGEAGEQGVGIASITFKEVKDNKSVYTVKFTNNETTEISILNGKDGEKGETGPKGDNGSNGQDTYDIYVKEYGYVGSKEDFTKDLAKGHIGTKKEYTIYCGYHHGNVGKPIFENKKFKNGEKVNFELPTFEDKYTVLTGAFESKSFNFDSDYLPPVEIDYTDYRAHDDVIILFDYSDMKLRVDPMLQSPFPDGRPEEKMLMQQGSAKTGIKLSLGVSSEHSTRNYRPLDDSEFDNIKGMVIENSGMNLTYDKETHTVKSDVAGSANIRLFFNKNSYVLNLQFYPEPEGPITPIESSLNVHKYQKDLLNALEIDKPITIVGTASSEHFYNETIKRLIEHNLVELVSKNNSNVVEFYSEWIYPVKAGKDVIQVVDTIDKKVIGELEVTVYKQGEAPKVEKANTLEIYANNDKYYAGQQYRLSVLLSEGSNIIDYSITDEQGNPVDDAHFGSMHENLFVVQFESPGTYTLTLETEEEFGTITFVVLEDLGPMVRYVIGHDPMESECYITYEVVNKETGETVTNILQQNEEIPVSYSAKLHIRNAIGKNYLVRYQDGRPIDDFIVKEDEYVYNIEPRGVNPKDNDVQINVMLMKK